MTAITRALIPFDQRNPASALLDQLDLDSGDRTAKRSGFGIMLVLAAIIATAGVLADSTATVIGAMIIAPLATPILGIAIGIVTGRPGLVARSVLWVTGGGLLVIAIGALLSLAASDPGLLTDNSQIIGRTSPGLLDLLAAVATGVAGAFAMSRKDLSAILPGVAISISLVPPLGVVGVALGHGNLGSAIGSLLLFLSNVVALVIAGGIVFTLAGYAREAAPEMGRRRRRSFAIVSVLALAVALPLTLNSLVTAVTNRWLTDASVAAEDWLTGADDVTLVDVRLEGATIVVDVRSRDGGVPATEPLRESLDDRIPAFIDVTVDVTVGSRIEVRQPDE